MRDRSVAELVDVGGYDRGDLPRACRTGPSDLSCSRSWAVWFILAAQDISGVGTLDGLAMIVV